jgi:hypothetical protein
MLLLNFLFSINKILGLIGFQFERDKKSFVVDKTQLWYSKAILLTTILLYPYCAYYMVTSEFTEMPSFATKVALVIDYIENYILVLTVFYSYGSKQSAIRRTLNNCVKILIELQSYERHTFGNEFLVVLIDVLLLMISWFSNVYSSLTTLFYNKLLAMLIVWSEIFIHWTVFNFLVIFVLIKYFLKKLNVLLLAKVHIINTNNSFVLKLAVCDQLDQLLSIYEKIVELCEDVCRIFEGLLLLFMSNFFITIAVQVGVKY